jgi:hypothetical protein
MVGLNYTVGIEDEPALHYHIGDGLPDSAVAEIHVAMRGIYEQELEDYHSGIPSNIILGRD